VREVRGEGRGADLENCAAGLGMVAERDLAGG
jgi:hypothetical protein